MQKNIPSQICLVELISFFCIQATDKTLSCFLTQHYCPGPTITDPKQSFHIRLYGHFHTVELISTHNALVLIIMCLKNTSGAWVTTPTQYESFWNCLQCPVVNEMELAIIDLSNNDKSNQLCLARFTLGHLEPFLSTCVKSAAGAQRCCQQVHIHPSLFPLLSPSFAFPSYCQNICKKIVDQLFSSCVTHYFCFLCTLHLIWSP